MSALLARLLLRILFFLEPRLELDEAKHRQFASVIESLGSRVNDPIAYDLPYPKHEFIRYLAKSGDFLFHGSNYDTLELLEPRSTTDFNGRPVNAVLATSDPIWSIFFAVLDWRRCRGSVRNGGFATGGEPGNHFYFFSIDRDSLRGHPWTQGMVYILPKQPFTPTSRGVVHFEWASSKSVAFIAKIPVSPLDFPFLDQVVGHPEG